ncbi:MAG: GtrA family protein [Bacillota bacterium]|nr:GtrA family protein [Bacillota bacterium]
MNSKVVKKVKRVKNSRTARQFSRYIVIGCSAAAIEYLSFLALLGLKIEKLISNPLAMAIGAFYSFTMNRHFNFKSNKNAIRQLVRYTVLFCFNTLLSDVLLSFITDHLLLLPAAYAKIPVMVIIAMWNFVMCKFVVYR